MINRERLAETFKTLVMIDSISREEANVSDTICRMLAFLKPEIFIDKAGSKTGSNTGNLIMKIPGDKNISPLMLNAHMDTVSPGKGVEPEFADGVFTSKGDTILGADDKSAIAIIIESLTAINENRLSHGPIELVFTICEEIGLLGAKNLDFNLIAAPYGYALDTSDIDAIITQAPAANQFEINLYGKDAHAGAEPEQGINAILLASRAIAKLSLGRIDEETTCNIGVLEAQGATNIVPKHVRVKGEARSHDEAKLQRVTDTIMSAFESVVTDYQNQHRLDDLPKFNASIHKEFSCTHIPDDHPLVSLAQKAAGELGRKMAPKRTGGGSDANIFFENGIVTGVIGTGMTDIHSTRESIRLDDMVKSAELLVEIIQKHGKNAE